MSVSVVISKHVRNPLKKSKITTISLASAVLIAGGAFALTSPIAQAATPSPTSNATQTPNVSLPNDPTDGYDAKDAADANDPADANEANDAKDSPDDK